MAVNETPQYPEWQPGMEIDFISNALTHLRTVLSEASLTPASPEVTALEAFAILLGPIALAYQHAPMAVSEHFVGLQGLYRHTGRKAVGKAKIYVSDSSVMPTIPANTVLRYDSGGQAGTLEFRTTETITIVTSETHEGTVNIEATETGTSHNGVPVGSVLHPENYYLEIEQVIISQETRAGEGVESDESFEQRTFAMLGRKSASLTSEENFKNTALTREEVGRAFVINNWDASTNTVKVGHVTVAITDTTGQALPENVQDEIGEWLEEQALASLVIHTTTPTYTTVNLSATVKAVPGANTAEVEAAVKRELDRRLNPAEWDWGDSITTFDIATWIDEVPGVHKIISVPSGTALAGPAPLPLSGTHTITVQL